MSSTPAAVELFAGGGGMALGTHEAGFEHLALIESEPKAVETLRLNARTGAGPTAELPLRPTLVQDFDYASIRREVSLVAAGAPCQPFSLAGVHRGASDERNLFPEVFRAQRELQPKALLLENVRGLARPSFRPFLEYILLQLAMPALLPKKHEDWDQHKRRLERALRGRPGEPTYDVWISTIECASYGVPQKRNRVFMVAFRSDLNVDWRWPERTHSKEALRRAQSSTGDYWDEHELEAPTSEVPTEAELDFGTENGHARWRTVRDALREVPEPERLLNGEPPDYHENHWLVPGARSYAGHTGSPLDEPAKTLKAGVHGVPGGENMLRLPGGEVRYFSIHEAALLQSFPRQYQFAGSRTAAMRQIGNAAPVRVVRVLAEAIKRSIVSPGSDDGSRSHHVDLVRGQRLHSVR